MPGAQPLTPVGDGKAASREKGAINLANGLASHAAIGQQTTCHFRWRQSKGDVKSHVNEIVTLWERAAQWFARSNIKLTELG